PWGCGRGPQGGPAEEQVPPGRSKTRRYSSPHYLFPCNPATISGIPSIVREVFKMLIQRSSDISSSEITLENLYHNRREWIKTASAILGLSAVGQTFRASTHT